MKRIDKLLAELRATTQESKPILCRTPEGEERPMDILQALCSGSTFVRTLDGGSEFDELYRALLSEDDEDFADLPEVE